MINRMRRVIIDTDVGVDDVTGICYAFSKCKIEALTVIGGNVSLNKGHDTLRRLNLLFRQNVPIFLGCKHPILPTTRKYDSWPGHGKEGVGEYKFPSNFYKLKFPDVPKTHASLKILDLAMKNPNELDLICLGPLTNIALCIQIYPEILQLFRSVTIMGGNTKEGNVTQFSEYNFAVDPEAAHIVLENASNSNLKNPLTVVDWNFCLDFPMPLQKLTHIFSLNTDFSNFLQNVWKLDQGVGDQWVCCDLHAVVVALNPEIIQKSYSCPASVELVGFDHRGELLIKNGPEFNKNLQIVLSYDSSVLWDRLEYLAKTLRLNENYQISKM